MPISFIVNVDAGSDEDCNIDECLEKHLLRLREAHIKADEQLRKQPLLEMIGVIGFKRQLQFGENVRK